MKTMNLVELENQLQALIAQIKPLDEEFKSLLDDLQVCQDEDILPTVQRLRKSRKSLWALREQRNEIQNVLSPPKIKHEPGQGLKILEENNARQAQIKAKRIEAERKAYNANLRKKEAQAAAAEAEALAYEAQKMAMEDRRADIIKTAIATGALVPIHETPLQKTVNRQKRSNGGVIRIESGAR